jgi:uncharacterized repeat protein (TIGR01451 family)
MNKFTSAACVMLFCLAAISVEAQHRVHLPDAIASRTGNSNPHTSFVQDSIVDYYNAEQNCTGHYANAYIWQVDSRHASPDTLVFKEAGEVFDSLIDGGCTPFDIHFPTRVITLEYPLGHENNSGLTDTVVFYMEETDPLTRLPNGNVLWADTIFTASHLSPSNTWLDVAYIQFHPNVMVPLNFFAGIKYFGAPADTLGILGGAYDMFLPGFGSMEATYGKALRKQSGQNYWRPDSLNQDYFYDQNSNSQYDINSQEAFPFQTCIILPTVTHFAAITGTVFKDLNQNGIFDSGEPPRPHTIVTAGNFSASTDANGAFTIYVDSGNYVVQPVIQGYFTVSTSPANVAVISYQASYNAGDFATNDIPNVHDLRIDVSRDIYYVPGFSGTTTIYYENYGTVAMSGTVKYLPDTAGNIYSVLPPPSFSNGDTLVWTFSNLLPGQGSFIDLDDTVRSTTPPGTLVYYYAEIQPIAGDTTPSDNFIAVNDSVRSSYDPNDKTPFPSGIGPLGEIASSQKMDFTIRFQNTGTYLAHTVIVRDTIDAGFNINSFNFISSSHPCTWMINSDRSVVFTFSNIMLADSNSNEPASHGFLKYSIYPDPNLAPGTPLQNTAYIFFDYNTPVITNTTLNTIAVPNSISGIVSGENSVSVFPNPFSDQLTIMWADEQEKPVRLILLDVSGRVIREMPVSGKQAIINRDELQQGLYFFRLETNTGKNYACGKIVAQ